LGKLIIGGLLEAGVVWRLAYRDIDFKVAIHDDVEASAWITLLEYHVVASKLFLLHACSHIFHKLVYFQALKDRDVSQEIGSCLRR
jgi:hypothetical protein